MKTVLILSNTFDSLVRFRLPVIEALLARGYTVHCAAPDNNVVIGEDLSVLTCRNVLLHRIPMTAAQVSPLADLRTCLSIFNLARSIRPDAALTYTIKPNTLGVISIKLAAPRCRIIALMNGMGLTMRGDSVRARSLTAIVKKLYRLAFCNCARVFFHNETDRSEFVSANILRADRTGILPGSGVDLKWYSYSPIPELPLRFLFLGRLIKEKGIFEFIEAASALKARHPEVTFTVVGSLYDSPTAVQPTELKKWQEAGLISYRGSVSDIRPLMKESHALVLPSYREGLSRALLEALAMGRPIITTTVPGCEELLNGGRNGYGVPPENAAALQAAMERCIARPHTLQEMGAAGRDFVAQNYATERVVEKLLPEFVTIAA